MSFILLIVILILFLNIIDNKNYIKHMKRKNEPKFNNIYNHHTKDNNISFIGIIESFFKLIFTLVVSILLMFGGCGVMYAFFS